jgi:hypothetical protein
MKERIRRPPRTPRRPRPNGVLRHFAALDDNVHVEMGLPSMKLQEGCQKAAQLLAKRRPVVLAHMPNVPAGESGMFEASPEELRQRGVTPTVYGVTDMPDEKALSRWLKLAVHEDASAEDVADAVLMLTLVPRVLKTLLSLVRPWHLGILAPELFPLGDKPEDAELKRFTAHLACALAEWGVIEVEEKEG